MEAHQRTAQAIETVLAVDEQATSQAAAIVAEHLNSRPDRIVAAAIHKANKALELPSEQPVKSSYFANISRLCLFGFTSIALYCAPNVFSQQFVLDSANQQANLLRAQASVEEVKAEQQRAIADARSENAVADPYEQLKVRDYVFDPDFPPPVDWEYEWSIASVPTRIIDQNNRCVGFLDNAQFTFDPTGEGVCKQ